MHPLARPGTNDTLNGLKPGTRIMLEDGRRGVLDQAIEIGSQGYVTLDDGSCETVWSSQVYPETGPPRAVADQVVEDIRWPQDFRLEGGQYVRVREPWE